MGDSHCLVFHAGGDLQGTGAGLAAQLAAELGAAVDVIGVRGSGATPARVNLLRRSKANPAYLASKKWIIWCFSARELAAATTVIAVTGFLTSPGVMAQTTVTLNGAREPPRTRWLRARPANDSPVNGTSATVSRLTSDS